jgi:DNA-binding NtrC family response regulator
MRCQNIPNPAKEGTMKLVPRDLQGAVDRLAEHALDSGMGLEMLSRLEQRIIQVYLEYHGGNQCHTAAALGIHRNTILRRMDELGIPSRHGLPRERAVACAAMKR